MIRKTSLLLSAALFGYVGVALAQSTVLGPATTTLTTTLGVATLAALPANPARKAVTICNGSASATATFTTGSVTPVSLTTGIVLQTGNVASSCFTIGSPGTSNSGGVGAQINVIGSTGGVPITFLEYY
jgi:hypothetical protein